MRLFDTILLLLTVHFLRVIYELASLIWDGFICPLPQMTDAVAKMPGLRCLKGCSPSSQMLLLFLWRSLPPASSLPPPHPQPAPFAVLVTSTSGCFKSTRKRQGQLGAKAGRFGGRYPLVPHVMRWGPKKTLPPLPRPPASNLESWL